jgi:hypothetical protein
VLKTATTPGVRPASQRGITAAPKDTFSRTAAIMAGRYRAGLVEMTRNSTWKARAAPTKP